MTGTFDVAGGGTGLVATTIAYTLSVSPLANLLVLTATWDNGSILAAPTVNGIAATLMVSNLLTQSTALWMLLYPPTGVLSISHGFGSRTGCASSASYIGADVRGLPAYVTGNNTAVATATGSVATTTTVPNMTVVSGLGVNNTPTVGATAGANTVARNTQFANSIAGGVFDSNGPVAAVGSFTENFAWTGSSTYQSVSLAFGPTDDASSYQTAGAIHRRVRS